MNQESIDSQTRHVNDVHRIEMYFASLSDEQIDTLIHEHQYNLSVRWEQCRRSFQMLFIGLNRGNHMPVDNFEIRTSREATSGVDFETMVRVWRDRKNNTFNVRPFTRRGRIDNYEFDTESFGDSFVYHYGTHRSKTARLSVDHDDPDSTIKLERIDGKLIREPSAYSKAVLLTALDDYVAPIMDNTEETLALLYNCALDPDLNPAHYKHLQLRNL